MPWRVAGQAEDQIDKVVMDSAERHGLGAATRYNMLIFAALTAIGEHPTLPGSHEVLKVPGVRSFHLRLARRLVEPGHRVHAPRHLVVYRLAADGVVEVLGLVHDRMLLPRAARRAQRSAEG